MMMKNEEVSIINDTIIEAEIGHIQLLNDYLHIKKLHYDDEYELSSHIKCKTPSCNDIASCICCNRIKKIMKYIET